MQSMRSHTLCISIQGKSNFFLHVPCNLLESSLAAAAKGSKGDASELLEEEEGPSPGGAPPPTLPDGGTPPDFVSLLDFEPLALGSPGGTV